MPGCSQQEAEEQLPGNVILFEVAELLHWGNGSKMRYGKKKCVKYRGFMKKNLLRDKKVRGEKSLSRKPRSFVKLVIILL